jgi:hypothetical protein
MVTGEPKRMRRGSSPEALVPDGHNPLVHRADNDE